jgi:hypothetical protein
LPTSINVSAKYGTESYVGPVSRDTNKQIISEDGKYAIQIFTQGDTLKINFAYDATIKKSATFNWNTGQGTGFDSIAGVYLSGIGQVYFGTYPKKAKVVTLCANTEGLQKVYTTSSKGACSTYGGAKRVLVNKTRNYKRSKRQGVWEEYPEYRKAYKSNWSKQNRKKKKSDKTMKL